MSDLTLELVQPPDLIIEFPACPPGVTSGIEVFGPYDDDDDAISDGKVQGQYYYLSDINSNNYTLPGGLVKRIE